MPVEISSVLHVLAHELRTPTGIAQGYLRLLLEDRLPEPADQRRALEQTQKALARITELSHESSALASFFDAAGAALETRIAARDVLGRVSAEAVLDPPVVVDGQVPDLAGDVLTFDAKALIGALVTMTKVTARELRATSCALSARSNLPGTLDVLVGRADEFEALGAGPQAPRARQLTLDRGGVGLSLVHADVVLEAHGAERWTLEDSRTTVGVRFRLEEGTRP